MTKQIYNFKNCYCDASSFAQGAKPLKFWQKDELLLLYEYVIAKNFTSGVKELWIVNDFNLDLSPLAQKYSMKIKSIVKMENINALASSMLVNDGVVIEVDKLEELGEREASEIVSFSARLNIPLLVHFGQDLYSLGALDKKYRMPPERVLEELGFLDRKCYLFGCNYLDKDALSLFENYEVEYIFSPLDDGENGRGFLNFKLYENKVCHLASRGGEIGMTANANFLRLSTNNLLSSAEMIALSSYGRLLPFESDDDEILRLLKSKITLPCENFAELEQKFCNLLAEKREKN